MAGQDSNLGNNTGSEGSRICKPSFWRTLRGKVTLGALLSAVVTAAGFASPEVRKATCLELPTATDLKYQASAAGEVPFIRLASSLSQAEYDDRDVVFRAEYYGEASRDYYALVLDPAHLKGRAVLNLREMGHVVTATPLGPSNTNVLPPFAVLVDGETLASLEGVNAGSLLELHGRAKHSELMHPKSMTAKSYAGSGMTANAPSGVTLVVTADRVQRLQPINDPRGRWSCRLIHGLEPLE